ncbi:CARDB domain-containing protein [Ideonella sp.]|uniref:CARDB domain-containing protein n=1 Tax=Ideonella sp. TaxID=1929293 RepID=UPI002B489744|nr:CARDB domain-containing protein [Ideonella sp.]HJV68114.1 CARDB domain-containing protein [Ideonella sp.]
MNRVATSLLLALTLAAGLAACGGSDGSAPVGSNADLAVVDTGPTEVYAGETVTHTITVTNEGPAGATDLSLALHLDGAPALGGITCAATGSASCPTVLGPSMTLASLPAGGGLVFHVDVPGAADLIGAITTSMTVSAAADTNRDNNTGEATTIAMDLRNGDYTVFASNGRTYTLSLDFNAMTYKMVGSQVNAAGTLTHDADGVGYVFGFTGTARFRMAPDLVVGGFDFNLEGSDHPYDHGVRPFVAARVFSSDTAALVGRSFNQLGVNLRRNDKLESVVLPSTFGTGTLQSCMAPVPVRVDQCPADYLATYALTTVGSDIKGIEATTGDVIHFRLAQSGSALILLRSEDAADATGRHFRVGLAETTGLAGGSFATSSTRAAWGTTTLTDIHYAYAATTTAGTLIDETADLSPLTSVAPAGLRRGNRSIDAAAIFLAQNDPLVLMLGASGGVAEGIIDIGLR